MITVVNYGLGNVLAIANIYKRLNIPVSVATAADQLRGASKLVLPGVGAFDWAMSRFGQSGMQAEVTELAHGRGVPLLGICVGMQMLADGSEEGQQPGLGWVPGQVRKFRWEAGAAPARLPHMGWNDVVPTGNHGLFRGLENGARFYFLHSYRFVPAGTGSVLAETDYQGVFAASVGSGNILGVQFHPEKSHQWGIQLLKNFAEL